MTWEAVMRALLIEDGDDVSGIELEPVVSGMSGAGVVRIHQPGRSPRYAKLEEGAAAAKLRDEAVRTNWLAAQGINVPLIRTVLERDGVCAVLMDAVDGVACDAASLPGAQMARALGQAFARLHALPVELCPFDETLDVRLSRAAQAVAAGEIDATHFEPRNSNVTPEQLFARLAEERPVQQNIVVIHGDATLENLMIDAAGRIGFIDCGTVGCSDRYTDLALLAADLEGHYGAQARSAFLAAYGVTAWDSAKAAFYLDLYELF